MNTIEDATFCQLFYLPKKTCGQNTFQPNTNTTFKYFFLTFACVLALHKLVVYFYFYTYLVRPVVAHVMPKASTPYLKYTTGVLLS